MVIRHRIPEDKKIDIITVFRQIEPKLPYPSNIELEYLFEVYNNFVKPPTNKDENINCSGCRAKVISQLRFLVREWKQEQQNLSK